VVTDLESKISLGMPYMIVTDNIVEKINALFCDLSGYEEKDILGRKIEAVWKQLLRISVDPNEVRLLKECNCFIFDKNRTVREVTIRYSELPESNQGVYTLEHKKNYLLDERFPFLEFVNAANDTGVVLISAADSLLLKANKGLFRYFSRLFTCLEDMLGKRAGDIIPDWEGSRLHNIFINVVNTGKAVFFEEQMFEHPEIGRFCLRYTITPIFEEGKVKYLVLIHNDVTARVDKRNQMEDIMRLKDEFLYFISHEFKTPLTVINAAVQNLEHIYASQMPDKAILLIEKVKQNAYQQLRLVNNLLDIARINAGKIKLRKRNIDIVFLTRAITDSVAVFAQQKGVEISFTSRLTERVIGIDDEKFERILLNLLSNAIKFSPAGKRVAVELSAKLYKKKRMVCIKVKDQGIGIPKEKQNLIFERFGQVDNLLTKQTEGSGIGLFLVKLMVTALEGDILLESEKGKGSVFTLMIPSKKVKEYIGEREIKQMSDSRLVQSIAIEFADIYAN